jgi:RES domain-containing protein
MRIWRISSFADLSGEGGTLVAGRWHFRGAPIVYCTDHPSTALLEILVHATRFTIPDHYQLLEIEIPDDIQPVVPHLPDAWEINVEATRRIGTSFLSDGLSALMSVPSVVMPKARNYLLNPAHSDATHAQIVETYRYPFDSRLVR